MHTRSIAAHVGDIIERRDAEGRFMWMRELACTCAHAAHRYPSVSRPCALCRRGAGSD